jgi:hypothetical protein
MAPTEYLSRLARFYADAVDANDFEVAESLGEELAEALCAESELDDDGDEDAAIFLGGAWA